MNIEERIRKMECADFDELPQPGFPEQQLPQPVTFFRIAELARFWDDPQTGGLSLADRQQQLITSLHGIQSPWAYVVLGEGGTASVFMGLPCRDGEARAREQQFLSAQLPGSSWLVDRPAPQILATLAGFPMVAGISGNPSTGVPAERQSERGRPSSGLESLFETMAGSRWAYMVLARPLAGEETADAIRMTEAELQETTGAFRRRGSAEENNNPLVARLVALLESAHRKLLQGQRHGMWDVQAYFLTDTASDCARGTQALHAAFGGPDSEPQPFRIRPGCRSGMRELGVRMATRLNTSEVAVLAGLPQREVAGLQVIDYTAFGLNSGAGGQGSLTFGVLMSGGTCTRRWFEIPKDSLSKHMFVAGVPGSGKTHTCLYFFFQLWREHGIPFLILEPAIKNEYRAFLRSSIGPDVRVFTAGDECSPLRINPLEVARGVHVQTHIGGLAMLFRAAFALEAPLPYVLDEAIHRVYEERGWNLVTGDHPSRGSDDCQPTIGDLLETCNKVIHDLEHEDRVKANIKGALKTRLTSLMRGAKGRIFNVRKSMSMEFLLSAPTVVEFSAMGDEDEKAFLLGCILLKLAQHRQVEGLATAGLRHVTLIEEAHRLLRNVPETAGTSTANPRRQAVEAFSNMLAELRAFGEGLVIVDQMPSKLVPDVIRNSGIKVIHRLVAEEERKIVGGAMSLNEAQTRFLSSLSTGQAIVYSDGSVNACRISVPDHAGHEGYLRENVTHAEVKAHMQGRLPPPAEQPSPVVAVPSDDLRQCMGTCPAGACAVKTAVDGYAGRYAPELELSFQRAVTEGFDALWQFGEGVARSIWPEGERRADAPFCTVMAVAGRMGMVERDMQVLRRNMARLRANQRQGGLS